MRGLSLGVVVALGLLAGIPGCAPPRPPTELVDARAAYARAASGTAAKVAPEELADAKRMLDSAERTQLDDPGSGEAKNLAYVAHRKTLIAEADARSMVAQVQEAQALQALTALRRNQLTDAHSRIEKSADEATLGARPLRGRKAKEALERLSPFAVVKESGSNVVVTLSDSVLFEGNSANLMEAARERLERVAQALRDVRARSVVVKGYMDAPRRAPGNPQGHAPGNDARASDLSQRRAEAVRQFLVSRGIAPESVRAVGLGTAYPIASNASSEGRNENRRVEVVIEGTGDDAAKVRQ